MAYVLPSFNLLCNIYDSFALTLPVTPPGPPRLADQVCQLTYGRRVQVMSTGGTGSAGVPLQTMNLLLPPLTDVRGPQDSFERDVVECPSGSGRWYVVSFVDDIGKGFANEHRTASIVAVFGGWVAPYG